MFVASGAAGATAAAAALRAAAGTATADGLPRAAEGDECEQERREGYDVRAWVNGSFKFA